MKNKQSAFTLIELLVVIAIIAILAAILFPVFAQAKVSAKKAATISGLKQSSLAIIMYTNDYDDTYPIRGTHNGNGTSWAMGACTVEGWGCPSWDKVIHPYTKTYGILESGLDRASGVPSNLGYVKRSFRVAKNVIRGISGYWWDADPQIGMLKPMLTTTSVANPSGTILMTEQRNGAVLSGTWWIWSTFWENWVWWTGSENTIPNVDRTDITDANTRYFEGIDFTNNTAAYAMTDGSVRTSPAGYLFPGYQQRLNVANPVNTALRGVCLDIDDWTADPANDCILPE